MLNIIRNNVNDRNSNRLDNVMGISGSELASLVGGCLHQLRCLLHQQCFDFASLERGNSPRGWGRGFKRYAIEPAPMSSAMPATRQTWLATATITGRLGHRAVNFAG